MTVTVDEEAKNTCNKTRERGKAYFRALDRAELRVDGKEEDRVERVHEALIEVH